MTFSVSSKYANGVLSQVLNGKGVLVLLLLLGHVPYMLPRWTLDWVLV